MRRFAFTAVPLCLLMVSVGCDGNDAPDSASVAQQTSQAASSTPNTNEQPQVADKQLPTSTPVPDISPVIQVGAAGKLYAPTKSEYAALPKVKLSVGGREYEGVSLALLAEKGSARAGAIVTIQGTRIDNLRLGAICFPLADIAATTVLVMDSSGHIALVSTTVPQDQWLKDVVSIALN